MGTPRADDGNTAGVYAVAAAAAQARREAVAIKGGYIHIACPSSGSYADGSTIPGTPIGRTSNRYRFSGTELFLRPCSDDENLNKYRARTPRRAAVAPPDPDVHDIHLAAALFSAREFALSVYPHSASISAGTNFSWPIVWTAQGRCHIFTPLHRYQGRRRLLYVDQPHNPHIVPMVTALQHFFYHNGSLSLTSE